MEMYCDDCEECWDPEDYPGSSCDGSDACPHCGSADVEQVPEEEDDDGSEMICEYDDKMWEGIYRDEVA